MPTFTRVFLLILILFWLISGVDYDSTSTTASLPTSRVSRLRQALDILQTTAWGDFSPRQLGDPPEQPNEPTAPPSPGAPDGNHGRESDGTDTHELRYRYLNMTGFRESDGYAWEDLVRFRDRCWEWIRNAAPQGPESDRKEGIKDTAKVRLPQESSLDEVGPTWQNITGYVRGDWVRRGGSAPRYANGYNLSAIEPSVRWPTGDGQEWNRNVSGGYGRMTLWVEEREQPRSRGSERDNNNAATGPSAKDPFFARDISANVTIQDNDKMGSMWDMRMHGVHWPRQGAFLLTTTSDKFSGIYGLPHLSPGPDFYKSSQESLNKSLAAVVREIERQYLADPSNPLVSKPPGVVNDDRNTMPHCEYVMFALVHPIDPLQLGVVGSDSPFQRDQLRELIKDLEDELRFPTGAPVKAIPEIRISAIAWSPDCSYFLESKGPPLYQPGSGQRSNHLVGQKEEVFLHKVKAWLLTYAIAFMGQMYLVKIQARALSTSPTLSRVSAYTLGMMITADLLVSSAVIMWTTLAKASFLASAVLAFASGSSCAFCWVFMNAVHKNLVSEWNREPPRSAGISARNSVRPIHPPVVEDQPPQPPLQLPRHPQFQTAGTPGANESGDETPGHYMSFLSVTGFMIFVALVLFFFGIASSTWPVRLRVGFLNTLAFVALSVWLPQIWRNLMRNSRGLTSRFVLGQSLLRLCPVAYLYRDSSNFALAEPDLLAFPLLAGWLFLQLAALAYQERLGPRHGLPKSWSWLPKAWDYHFIFSEDGAEAGNFPMAGSDTSSMPASPTRGPERGPSSTAGRTDDRERGKGREGHGVRTRAFKCTICHEMVQVPFLSASHVRSAGEARAAQAYMYTPCRHIFHTECLTSWLEYQLCCPICREGLPPV